MALCKVSLVDSSRLQLLYTFASHRTHDPFSLVRVTPLKALDRALAVPEIVFKVTHIATIAEVEDSVTL